MVKQVYVQLDDDNIEFVEFQSRQFKLSNFVNTKLREYKKEKEMLKNE